MKHIKFYIPLWFDFQKVSPGRLQDHTGVLRQGFPHRSKEPLRSWCSISNHKDDDEDDINDDGGDDNQDKDNTDDVANDDDGDEDSDNTDDDDDDEW